MFSAAFLSLPFIYARVVAISYYCYIYVVVCDDEAMVLSWCHRFMDALHASWHCCYYLFSPTLITYYYHIHAIRI